MSTLVINQLKNFQNEAKFFETRKEAESYTKEFGGEVVRPAANRTKFIVRINGEYVKKEAA